MIGYSLHRWHITDKGILGELCRSDEVLCFTLEPPVREEHGAIPEGRFPLFWTLSPRLHKFTPRIGVPNRPGILIHAGNTLADSEGCILVGTTWEMTKDGDLSLFNSRTARDHVYHLIEADVSNGGFADLLVVRDPEV